MDMCEVHGVPFFPIPEMISHPYEKLLQEHLSTWTPFGTTINDKGNDSLASFLDNQTLTIN